MRSIIIVFLFVVAMPKVVRGALRGHIHDQSKRKLIRNNQKLKDNNNVQEVQKCMSNDDCTKDSYCAAGQCLSMGGCETDWDCRNPNNTYPIIECIGPLVCNKANKECRRECGPTSCSDGTSEVSCLIDPCSSAANVCTMKDFISCNNDYCGSCNALVFNSAGYHELCTTVSEPENLDLAKTCTSSVDCGELEYCSKGICTESGLCSSDADCFNPDNVHAVTMCVGPISCDKEQKRCSRTCDATDCPTDKPPMECLQSTCENIANSCQSDIVNCVDYNCGDCGAFVFDAAGYQVCTEVGTKNLMDDASCTTAKDCPVNEYCAGGKCLPDGQCNTNIDCMNPTNIYPVVACVGVLGCYGDGDGMCGVQCGASSCPDGIIPAECLTAPCDSPPACEEAWEYCINDYCSGECGVILLDAGGKEVKCTPK